MPNQENRYFQRVCQFCIVFFTVGREQVSWLYIQVLPIEPDKLILGLKLPRNHKSKKDVTKKSGFFPPLVVSEKRF